MEIIEFIIMLLSAAAVLYLLKAFLAQSPGLEVENMTEDKMSRGAAAIQEIDFDFAAGKLSRIDYETIRQETVAELAAELKKEGRGKRK